MEKSGILDDDIMAYRKGRNAEDIATCIVLILEEANITGEPLAIIMEDEEKIFNRVTPEIQVTTMATHGMPEQGWIEIKGEDMLVEKMHPHNRHRRGNHQLRGRYAPRTSSERTQ